MKSYIPYIPLQLLALLLLPSLFAETKPEFAKSRITSAVVHVAPNHVDWSYALGDPVTFTITVLADSNLVEHAEISYRIGPEKQEGDAIETTFSGAPLRIDAGTMDTPGFLRCTVSAKIDGGTYRALATVAFDPEKIEPTQSEPADFDEFWSAQLQKLEEIPLELTKTLVPEQCTSEVNVYHISYQTAADYGSSTFYGMLATPRKPGKYPAVLRVPGAGVRSYKGDTGLASKGIIVLTVGIHGIPVNLPEEVYSSLKSAALRSYWSYNLDNKDLYYFRRVYLGCVRGNDVLTQHEDWDGKTLVVAGGSQGGQLSIVTAALDKRVTGNVSNYPAFCDVTGYLHGRAGGWPHMFSSNTHTKEENIETTGYYDAVNFAKRLRNPSSYAWGYNDVTCPPTSMFAAYNSISSPKELHLQLEMGHRSTEEFGESFNQRILKMVGID